MRRSVRLLNALPTHSPVSVCSYVYARELFVDEETVLEMLLLAEQFDIEALKAQCAEFLAARLDPDNCCRLLNIAVRMNAVALQVRTVMAVTASLLGGSSLGMSNRRRASRWCAITSPC